MSDDLISRKKAVDLLVSEASQDGAYGYLDAKEVHGLLASLPSEPERKTGRWIDESVVTGTTIGGTTHIRQYRCSVCGGLFGRLTDNYCYNCGAKMEDDHET